MLFKGVEEDRLDQWAEARHRADAERGVDWWRDIVGVDSERVFDQGLFRVLEWGGMEVVRT